MALESIQPLTEMSTRSIYWGKGGRCVRLTTYHHPVPLSRNLGTLTSWNLLGLSRSVTGLLYLYLHILWDSTDYICQSFTTLLCNIVLIVRWWSKKTETCSYITVKNSICVRRTESDLFWTIHINNGMYSVQLTQSMWSSWSYHYLT